MHAGSCRPDAVSRSPRFQGPAVCLRRGAHLQRTGTSHSRLPGGPVGVGRRTSIDTVVGQAQSLGDRQLLRLATLEASIFSWPAGFPRDSRPWRPIQGPTGCSIWLSAAQRSQLNRRFCTRLVHGRVGSHSKMLKLKSWLPGMDSNHDSRLQRPLSYH